MVDRSTTVARSEHVLKRISEFLNEYLRINAIRRMLSIVDVRPIEVGGLVVLAVLFAIFEGVGLALLLPILQYADGGQTAIIESSGIIWRTIASFMSFFHLPVTLPILLLLAFIPILLRQGVFYFNAWYSAVVSTRIGMRLKMQTLDTILDADPEFFSRHSVGHLAGVVINQTTRGRQRHPCRDQAALYRAAHGGLRRHTACALGSAHAHHPALRGHGVLGGAGQHQTDPRLRSCDRSGLARGMEHDRRAVRHDSPRQAPGPEAARVRSGSATCWTGCA